MELYQLRAFLTVAEEGNLTHEAEKLFTSPRGSLPALVNERGSSVHPCGTYAELVIWTGGPRAVWDG